jgi:lipoprotein-releasing system permease protein
MIPFEGYIALRYLSASRQNGFLAIMNVVSMIGVAVGVFAQIGALALMTGVQGDLRERLLRGTAPVIVQLPNRPGPREIDVAADRLATLPHVVATAPVVRGIGLLSSASGTAGVQIRGIDPERERSVTEYLSRLQRGNAAALPSGGRIPWTILGVDLAHQLDLRVGDSAELMVSFDTHQWMPGASSRQTVQVVGIFALGVSMFDASPILLPFDSARRLLRERAETSIQLRLDDVDQARTVAETAKRLLPESRPTEWTTTNASLFGALQLEKIVMVASVGLIVAISAMNILSVLALLITKKLKDIAILRTMGTSAKSISGVFFAYAFAMALVGAVCGTLASYAAGYVINKYRLISLSDANEIPYVRFMFSLPSTVAMVCLALCLCLLAAWYPARKASRIQPVDAMRD